MNMSAQFSQVSTRPNGICVTFKEIEVFLCGFPQTSKFRPASTFNSESLSVRPTISRCLIRLNSNMSTICIPTFASENHSIASASPLDVAVVACLLHLHSIEYVLPFCPASTIKLLPSLRGQAKFESL